MRENTFALLNIVVVSSIWRWRWVGICLFRWFPNDVNGAGRLVWIVVVIIRRWIIVRVFRLILILRIHFVLLMTKQNQVTQTTNQIKLWIIKLNFSYIYIHCPIHIAPCFTAEDGVMIDTRKYLDNFQGP
jgi:hypothetical protein